MKKIQWVLFIILLFFSGCNSNNSADKAESEKEEFTPEVVEDGEYVAAIDSFHFTHRDIAKEASRATISFLNNQSDEEEFKSAVKELREYTKNLETLPVPQEESELKYFDEIYREAMFQLPDSLESIVYYTETGDQAELDDAIDYQEELGSQIDFAAQQIFARRGR